eukprot:4659726-Amphidinium_carterae.1
MVTVTNAVGGSTCVGCVADKLCKDANHLDKVAGWMEGLSPHAHPGSGDWGGSLQTLRERGPERLLRLLHPPRPLLQLTSPHQD